MLQITILGCGSSLGVPVIGCSCPVCKSTSPYNKRRRSAIVITEGTTKILIDFGFDIKDQLLQAGIDRLDAAILTHDHADHSSGIDNLRVFRFLQHKPLDIYTDHDTATAIEAKHKYLFDKELLSLRPVNKLDVFKVKDLEVRCFPQIHGPTCSLGIRVKDFVYSTDVVDFPQESEQFLYNAQVLILDCLDYRSTLAHAGLDKVLEWDQKFQPKQIFLTNMHHNIDYHDFTKHLPPHIRPLYDGMQITYLPETHTAS